MESFQRDGFQAAKYNGNINETFIKYKSPENVVLKLEKLNKKYKMHSRLPFPPKIRLSARK